MRVSERGYQGVQALKSDFSYVVREDICKATVTRCDLSPRFFCIDATLLCEFESDEI